MQEVKEKRHPYCESKPLGWFGHGHTKENPAEVTLDFDYLLPDGVHYIPAGTPHKQWETENFGWWSWTDKWGQQHLAQY